MSTRADRTGGFDRQNAEQAVSFQSLTRYDLALAVIPAVFVLTLLTAAVLDLPVRTALTGGSLVGALIVVDALFVNPPTRGRRRGRT
ncbi:MAG: hypothetical protein ABEH86_09445 [Haloarcula sp.]